MFVAGVDISKVGGVWSWCSCVVGSDVTAELLLLLLPLILLVKEEIVSLLKSAVAVWTRCSLKTNMDAIPTMMDTKMETAFIGTVGG